MIRNLNWDIQQVETQLEWTNETGEAKPNIIHTGQETITINPETERDQL